MQLFIVAIFTAFIVGSGSMLAPAIPTTQPRIGLASSLVLALIVGGTVFWAEAFGWSTLVIDYILFGLLTGVVLGGTLSSAQSRAEARGEILEDADQGWPGPEDLGFFGAVAFGIVILLLIIPLPMNVEAQTSGYLALTARLGETFNNLAPFHPEVDVLFAPGFQALTAYLSQQLNQPIPTIQLGIAGALMFLCVLLAYDLGSEIRDKQLGRGMALATLIGTGLITAFIDAHFSGLMGLAFILGFLIFFLRFFWHQTRVDLIGAGLMLGAVGLANPTSAMIVLLGFVPFLALLWVVPSDNRPKLATWLGMIVGIPMIAILATSPWLINNFDLITADIASPIQSTPGNFSIMILNHGIIVSPLAAMGAVYGMRSKNIQVRYATILALGWLILIFDFAVTGILTSLVPTLGKFANPERIAWHGPVIAYSILGGMGLLGIWKTLVTTRIRDTLRRNAYTAIAILAVVPIAVGVFHRPILATIENQMSYPGILATAADIEAMLWIRDNASGDVRVLNYPYEGEWAAVVAERDTIYFPLQPYFDNTNDIVLEQQKLLSFWSHPADSQNIELLQEADISYVIVPQGVANEVALADELRWQPVQRVSTQSDIGDADYLELVFEKDGAQVYKVKQVSP